MFFTIRYGVLVDADVGHINTTDSTIEYTDSSRPDLEYFVYTGPPKQTMATVDEYRLQHPGRTRLFRSICATPTKASPPGGTTRPISPTRRPSTSSTSTRAAYCGTDSAPTRPTSRTPYASGRSTATTISRPRATAVPNGPKTFRPASTPGHCSAVARLRSWLHGEIFISQSHNQGLDLYAMRQTSYSHFFYGEELFAICMVETTVLSMRAKALSFRGSFAVLSVVRMY